MSTMSSSTRPARRRTMAVAWLGAIALLAAACGGAATDEASSEVASLGDSTESAAAATDEANDDSSDAPVDPEDAMLAFNECMEEQGVSGFDDSAAENNDDVVVSGSDGDDSASTFVIGGDDVDPEEFDAALETCNELLGAAGGDFEMTPEQEAQLRDAELAFNQCMEEKGFAIGASGGGEGLAVDGGSGEAQSFEIDGDVDFEEIEAAADECDDAFDEISEQFEAEAENQ